MIAPYREKEIVLDIGTGDGRFVSASAKANPDKFYIGIDANTKPLEKPSMKATRKPAKGGLPNAMFVQAAVEDLPEELNGIADEISINFPWGSLLGAAATGNAEILASLKRIAAPGCSLQIIIGIDPVRDKCELERLAVPDFSLTYIERELIPRYETLGHTAIGHCELKPDEWSRFATSWARKLSRNDLRKVFYLAFKIFHERVPYCDLVRPPEIAGLFRRRRPLQELFRLVKTRSIQSYGHSALSTGGSCPSQHPRFLRFHPERSLPDGFRRAQ